MFIVVTSVAVEKDFKDVVDVRRRTETPVRNPLNMFAPPAAAPEPAPAAKKAGRHPFRTERRVSGRELAKPMKVKLELDVFQFASKGE
jgi:hypothetical protein